MFNPSLFTKMIKLVGSILFSIIRSHDLNFVTTWCFSPLLKFPKYIANSDLNLRK